MRRRQVGVEDVQRRLERRVQGEGGDGGAERRGVRARWGREEGWGIGEEGGDDGAVGRRRWGIGRCHDRANVEQSVNGVERKCRDCGLRDGGPEVQTRYWQDYRDCRLQGTSSSALQADSARSVCCQ